MEIEAPYLKAIQAIDGTTPGEKQKTIHDIARQIARAESSGGDSVKGGGDIPDVPEPLKPLVRAEVAKILRQYEGIIEALKSEDMTVVSRALQAKWFFDGSDTTFVNAKYFLENVFSQISLYARLKIVKNLGIYLENSTVAADFFITLAQQYGVSQATPLLIACDEDFAFKMIIENKIVLSSRMAAELYRKYPNLVVKYLMLSKPADDDDVRNLHRINISDYTEFLPVIAADRFDDFMRIYNMHESLDVKLGRRAVNTFLKTQLDLLVTKPDRYLKLLSLKTVTHKLSADNFAKMLKNIFPEKMEDFSYYVLNDYLTYYKPEEERITLMLNTFQDKYGKDLLNCENLVSPDLMKKLPAADRIKLARLKLEEDKDWHLFDFERSWRCYLPTSESIPALTTEIAKTSDASKRGQLLRQLILTSQINDDEDALLKVLNYIYDRHRNDQRYIFYNCLSFICDSFDVATLSLVHWESLYKYIKLAEVQDELVKQSSTMLRVLEVALHYCSINELSMDDYVRMFVDINLQLYDYQWNILIKFPDLEEKFLNLFIEVIPKQYPSDNKIWKDKEIEIIKSLALALWDFNNRNKNSNRKFKKLYISDYPWLLEKSKTCALRNPVPSDTLPINFLELIKANERKLYRIWIREVDQFWYFAPNITCDVLRRQPQRVLEDWKIWFNYIQKLCYCPPRTFLLIVKSRWYQQLPINLLNESLKKHNDPEICTCSLQTLALLADGETYAKIIEPSIPTKPMIDVADPEVKATTQLLFFFAANIQHINPPVSLDVIARFCVGDYLQMAIGSLTSVCHRVPVTKVIPFAETLTKRGVSVMKHGIRLICSFAPLEQIYTFLTNLWNTERHTSIRGVVFKKMYDLFCKQQDSRSWNTLRTCIDTLNTNDDEKVFKSLTTLSTVPNEYLYEYIKSAFSALKSMERTADDPKLYINLTCRLIRNIDGPIVKILPDEYSQDLIKQYLFVFDYNPDIFEAGLDMTINSYLLSSQNYDKSRFKFFGDYFRDSVEQYWDKPHPKCFKFYPMNSMAHKFFYNMTFSSCDLRIDELMLKIFLSALKPQQDAISYVNLVFAIEWQKSETSVDFGNRMTQKIPELVEIFSPECVIFMSHELSGLIKCSEFCQPETDEERMMTIIEILANSGKIHCAFVAADMLFNDRSMNLNKRYRTLVLTLRNFRNPRISWCLNKHLAKQSFEKGNDDQLDLFDRDFENGDKRHHVYSFLVFPVLYTYNLLKTMWNKVFKSKVKSN